MSELNEIWNSICSTQVSNLPEDFLNVIESNLSAGSRGEVDPEIVDIFREVEFGYREPTIRPEAHCASVGALLSIVTTMQSLAGHYRFALMSEMENGGASDAYMARVMLLDYSFSAIVAITKLLSSRNEVAIRVLARSLLEASEYLLVVPRDKELSTSYVRNKSQFKYDWGRNLRPAKIRARRSKAIIDCNLFRSDAAELNGYFDSGHRFLSMASHPSGFAGMASMFAALPQKDLPTPKLRTSYLLQSSVEYSCFPPIIAIISDIEHQRNVAENRTSAIIPDLLGVFGSELARVRLSFFPILKGASPSS